MDVEESLPRSRALGPDQVFSDIVDTLVEQTCADVVWLQYMARSGKVYFLQSDDVFDSPPLEWPLSACRSALDGERPVYRTNYDVSRIMPTKSPLFFASLVCNPLELHRGRVVVSVGWFDHHAVTPRDRRIIELCTKLGGAALEHAARDDEVRQSHHLTIRSLLRALEMRDSGTIAHLRRVTTYTLLLAEVMGVDPGLYDEFALGAALHDVGKIAIPDSILRKPGPLTQTEYGLIQQHPVIGYGMLRCALASHPIALEMVRHHHERYDGAGYPDKLAGPAIPFAARLLALADAFDGMTNVRPYKRALSIEHAREEVLTHRGTQFCPECVDAFLNIDTLTLEAVRRGALDWGA